VPVEAQLHGFLTSALDEGNKTASCPSHFILRKRPPGWKMDPRVDLDTEEEKFFLPTELFHSYTPSNT
jgi:hypothetical protein